MTENPFKIASHITSEWDKEDEYSGFHFNPINQSNNQSNNQSPSLTSSLRASAPVFQFSRNEDSIKSVNQQNTRSPYQSSYQSNNQWFNPYDQYQDDSFDHYFNPDDQYDGQAFYNQSNSQSNNQSNNQTSNWPPSGHTRRMSDFDVMQRSLNQSNNQSFHQPTPSSTPAMSRTLRQSFATSPRINQPTSQSNNQSGRSSHVTTSMSPSMPYQQSNNQSNNQTMSSLQLPPTITQAMASSHQKFLETYQTNNQSTNQSNNQPINPKFLDSLPQAPFDIPSDRDFLNEKSEHLAYMFGFRTTVCQDWLQSLTQPNSPGCPYDAYTCFFAHSKQPKRRKPLLQHGRYSYIPTRCRYLLNNQSVNQTNNQSNNQSVNQFDERDCPQGVHCRFAHVTEEVIYHPSKYKTQLCAHAVDRAGVCSGYGAHCAKAHGEADRRAPVYEAEDNGVLKWTSKQKEEFVCPNQTLDPSLVQSNNQSDNQRELERRFYMYLYKTRKCQGFPFNCQCDGLDYHRDEERRRGPVINYAPMPCPNVKPYLNAEWGDPNVDCSGKFKAINQAAGRVVHWDCEYAHTLLEVMYSPSVYKTSPCDHFDEKNPQSWRCVWKRRCAHAHGKDDMRTKEEAAEEWKEHLALVNQTINQSISQALSGAALPTHLQPPSMPSSTVTTPILAPQSTPRSVRSTLGPLASSSWSSERAGMSSSASAWNDTPSESAASSVVPSPLLRAQKRLSLFDMSAGPGLWSSPLSSASTLSISGTSPDDINLQSLTPLDTAQSPSDDWSRRRSVHSSSEEMSDLSLSGKPQRSPSPSMEHLIHAVSSLEDSSSHDLVPLTDDGRISFDPHQAINQPTNDGVRTFAGICTRFGHCGVKLLQQPVFDAKIIKQMARDARQLMELSTSPESAHLTRYLDMQADESQLVIAVELHPTNLSLYEMISFAADDTSRPSLDPIALITQLFSALALLHRHSIVHGDITPMSVTLSEDYKTARFGDIDRSSTRFNGDENDRSVFDAARSRDVFQLTCLFYYMLTGGISPFQSGASLSDEWHQAALQSPLDTSMLTPSASHFILHVLFTPAHQRWSASQALQHPVVWSQARAISFICSVAKLLDNDSSSQSINQSTNRSPNQPSSTPTQGRLRSNSQPVPFALDENKQSIHRSSDSRLEAATAEFCASLDALGASILPPSGDWTSLVHNSLYDRHLARIDAVDGKSVTSLVRFIAAVVSHLLHAPLLSCLVHSLFKLDHRPNCTRPRRLSITSRSVSQSINQSIDAVAEDRRIVLTAIGDFFLPRFPALLISVFHLAQTHLASYESIWVID